MKKKVVSVILMVLIVLQSGIASNLTVAYAEGTDDYEGIIKKYYVAIENGNVQEMMNIYSEKLAEYIQPFANDESNMINKQGIYNIKNCNVEKILNIKSAYSENYDGITYNNCITFFVCVNMDVYNSDKYYRNGMNYFLISIGENTAKNIKIYNIEIPDFKDIKNMVGENAAEEFYRERNTYLYNDEAMILSIDSPVYVDRVENPSSIRIYVNGDVEQLDFRTYLERTVAAECNYGLEGGQGGYNAAAMACKMFAIHKCLRAAHGGNYDILVPTDQDYNAERELSNAARTAINNIYNWFALDVYGAIFPTFYRTRASNSGYCVQNGGILPQIEAGNVSTDWKVIFRYYYTRDEDVAYYNNEMNYGSLIFSTAHTHDWSHGSSCWYCGAEG